MVTVTIWRESGQNLAEFVSVVAPVSRQLCACLSDLDSWQRGLGARLQAFLVVTGQLYCC